MTPPAPPPSSSPPAAPSGSTGGATASDALPLLLVVDDDPGQRQLLETVLTDQGFPVATAARGAEALARLEQDPPVALVVSDVRMPEMTGLEMLRRLRETRPRLPVLLVTAYADIRDAVEAMRDGAVNYLEKPIDLDELLATVRHALGLNPEPTTAAAARFPTALVEGLVHHSPALRDILRQILAVAPTDARVLVTGDSGVGKGLVAERLHRLGHRARFPFIQVNCAGIPRAQMENELFGLEPGAFDDYTVPAEGAIEQAEGGTLLLDEVGELPPELQARLVRLIETGHYRRVGATHDRAADIRVLATSRVDLEAECAAGRFREDLLYRLAVFEIHVPPLAERREDILPMASLFLERAMGDAAGRPRISAAAMLCLETYAWPGNARELRNAMDRAALLARGGMVLPEHLPRRVRETSLGGDTMRPGKIGAADGGGGESGRTTGTGGRTTGASPRTTRKGGDETATSGDGAGVTDEPAMATMDDIERSVILQTLRENAYNRSETARRLGISRRALIYKLRRFREQGFPTNPTD